MTTGAALSEREREWDRFRQLTSTVNHWDRPGWTEGRRAYYWYLTFGDVPRLRELAARCQVDLELPYLDLVPVDDLHLTMQRVAFADETSPQEVREVLRESIARTADLAPFEINLGPLAGSAGAVRLTASPAGPIAQLRDRLSEAIAARNGEPAEAEDGTFRPHVGIGYFNAAVDPVHLVRAIAPLRKLPTVTTTVREVRLVLLRREGRLYQWDDVDRVQLASRDAAGQQPGRDQRAAPDLEPR